MADFQITNIKPPFAKGRIHSFRAENHCTVKKVKMDIDSTEPKKVIAVVVVPGEYKEDKKGNRQPDVRPIKSEFELKEGHRLYFILDDHPHGIDHIDLNFTVVKYTGPKA